MTRGRRTPFVGIIAVGAVLLGACSPAGSGATRSPEVQTSASTRGSTAAPLPPTTPGMASPEKNTGSAATPFEYTDPYAAVTPSPGAPPLDFGQPVASLDAVLNNHGRQRVDGEIAARDIAKLLLDSRSSISGEEVLGLISSPNLPARTRAGLIWDYDRTSTRGANMRRRCLPAAGAYARSSYQGPAGQPTKVSFNFACFMWADLLNIGSWYITSYDVEPSPSGGWRLAGAGFGKAPIGLYGITMTAAEKSEFLVGPGWRRLSE